MECQNVVVVGGGCCVYDYLMIVNNNVENSFLMAVARSYRTYLEAQQT